MFAADKNCIMGVRMCAELNVYVDISKAGVIDWLSSVRTSAEAHWGL